MSRNNITFESNKRLFESRLQMKTNSNSINKISLGKKNNSNINESFLNNTQPFTRVIFHKNRKNQSILENSFINNINNNFSLNKKIIKIRRNKKNNKKINLNINSSHDKSNILIKDITFFHLKNSFNEYDKRNKTILNIINKRMTQQNSINKSLGRKNKNHKLGSISLISKKIKKTKVDTSSISSTKKKMNIKVENKNNSNNNNKLIFKDKYISKFKIKSRHVRKRNNSSLKRNSHHQNSLLIHKIKKIKLNKRPDLNSANLTNNNSILSQNLNHRGRNMRNNNNKNGFDITIGQLEHTQRNLFAEKNIKKLYKNTFGETKYKNNKLSNNNSTLKKMNNTINYDDNITKVNKSKKTFNNNNINSSNISNKFLLKNKEKKIGRNYKNNINKKFTYNKFNKKGESLEFKALDISKRNNDNTKLKELEKINKKNEQCNIKKKNEIYIEKKEEIREDNNNGTSTKTNDEFFSEKKDDKINESSIEEDSGILSMNEIEDIIIYNDMKDIDRDDDDYLFKPNDHDIFIKDYKKIITNLFFYNKNSNSENYKQSKIKIKKKLIEMKNTINNDYHKNDFNDLNVYSNYNSSRESKYNHTLY